VPETAPPILRLARVEVIETAPAVALTAAEVVTVELALRVAVVAAETIAEILIVEPLEVTLTLPVVEVKVAVELEIAPEPVKAMFPLALTKPVGAIDVPPVMLTVPRVEVSAPAPEYAPVGFM
jgi:hypothetical protein